MPKLPQWKFKKQIWADKIINVRFIPKGDCKIMWELESGERIAVSNDLLCRGTSTPIGGYYVLFDNGYEGWMPADVFEAGYIKVED
jgi:hypothetical protein